MKKPYPKTPKEATISKTGAASIPAKAVMATPQFKKALEHVAAIREAQQEEGDTIMRIANWIDSLPRLRRDAPYWTNGMFANDARDAAEFLIQHVKGKQ